MKRRLFIAAAVAAGSSGWQRARADDRMRVLWLARGSDEVRVPFTRDGTLVYLAGYDAICWLLRDLSVPAEKGYVAISIDLVQTLWEMQQRLGDRAIQIERGFSSTCPHDESPALARQHCAGLAVDARFSLGERRILGSAGFLRDEDYVHRHVHVAALRNRWQSSRIV